MIKSYCLHCKSFFYVAILILYSINLPLNAATLIVNNGLETGDLTGLRCSGNCPKIATNPVANGKYSGNFYLDRTMPTSYRTEATLTGGNNTFYFGQEYWLSLDYFYKDWVKDKNGEIAPFQVHERPAVWDTACLGSAVGRAPFLMLSTNDEVLFKTYGGNTLWKGAIEKGKWLNITVHFIISQSKNGFIEAWKDGVKLGRVDGINAPQTDLCGNDMREPYLKMGIYKWAWKNELTDSSRRQLLIDNLKLAKGSDGYSLVNSKSTTTSTSTSTTSTQSTSVQDTTAPTLSNIQAEVTDTTATITWNTNEAANSIVKYGLSSSYGSSINDNALVTSHSVTLNNLTANKLYHYRVFSKDSSGNVKSSADLTFTTNTAVIKEVVAHWTMTDGTSTTVTDVSGNGHTGTLVNGAQRLTNGGGVKFDGVNDYINTGKFDVPGNAMTLSAWVWSDDLANCAANDCRIISKATGTGEQEHYFMVSTIKVNGVTRLRYRLKTKGATSTLIATSGKVLNNTWVHVAAVYDGTTMRLYQDGVEVGSMAKQGSMTTNSGVPVWIGSNPTNASSRPWKGQIDEVHIYNYALTNQEIANLAN